MSWKPIFVQGLIFLSSTKSPAICSFDKGLNVISGATDTGKSFIFEAIDFMLASQYPTKLRDIDERVGYDRARLIIGSDDGYLTLERPTITGSNFKVCFQAQPVGKFTPDLTLVPNFKPGKSSLSELLLERIDLTQKYIQAKEGETKPLGFRQLVQFILVSEENIIKRTSNIIGDQVVSITKNYSTFKLLLTGIDDNALHSVQNATIDRSESLESSVQNRLELLDERIKELDQDLVEEYRSLPELDSRLTEINNIIFQQSRIVEETNLQLKILSKSRIKILRDQELIESRISEISSLLSRFSLLKEHYNTDLKRLSSIEESGSIFVHLSETRCPLCGASKEIQHLDEECDGNVSAVVQAAKAEVEKVSHLLNELKQTISDLSEENDKLLQQKMALSLGIAGIDSKINNLTLEEVEFNFNELMNESLSIREIKEKVKKRDELLNRKETILGSLKSRIVENTNKFNYEKPDVDSNEIPKSILNKYAQKVEDLLKRWHFPDCNRVYFDEQDRDIVIDGKPRGSRGKGLRAIAQAAMTIGLMDFCRENSLSHPGFVVLDSPLLGYYKPDGKDDSLVGTDLKEKFYEDLSANYSDCQIIIVENEDAPPEISNIQRIHFTKNPNEGRFGFFPPP